MTHLPTIKIGNHNWHVRYYSKGISVRCELTHKNFMFKGIGESLLKETALQFAKENLGSKMKGPSK